MINDAEHLFKWLLAICIYSLEKRLFKSFAYVKIGLFIFSLLNYVFFYILDTSPSDFQKVSQQVLLLPCLLPSSGFLTSLE
jgi:hypothetical protein